MYMYFCTICLKYWSSVNPFYIILIDLVYTHMEKERERESKSKQAKHSRENRPERPFNREVFKLVLVVTRGSWVIQLNKILHGYKKRQV